MTWQKKQLGKFIVQRIGASLVIFGLLGVPVLALMGVGTSTLVGTLIWAASCLSVVCFGVRKHKGIRNWLNDPIEMAVTAPSILLLCVGLIFASAGAGIIVWGTPYSGPNAMSREQIIFFGSMFFLMGVGECLLWSSIVWRPDPNQSGGSDQATQDENLPKK
jgi:hypothetical protein